MHRDEVFLADLITTNSSGLSVFGSSQLEGCRGDFCHFDTSYLQDPAMEDKARTVPRKKPKQQSEGSSAKLNPFDADAATQLNVRLKERGPLAKKSVSPLRSTSLKSLPSPGRFKRIPYNAIVQARSEMQLVKLMLLRHKNGEKGDYCSEESFNDVVGGAKMPSRYYKDVEVCENCYVVYQMIETSRSAALQKFSKRKAGLPKGFGDRPIFSDYSKNASQQPFSNERFNAALKAIEELTKLDVAEIRTMLKPPPAVAVVLEAVTLLLTGAPLAFPEARKLMGNGDQFLQMLRDFRPDAVDELKLKLIQPYVDNSFFRPEYVVDVSRCASKFCAWVLGVVEAARWLRGIGQRKEAEVIVGEVKEEELSFVEKLQRRKARLGVGNPLPLEPEPTTVARMTQSLKPPPTLPRRLEDAIDFGASSVTDEAADKLMRERNALRTSQKKSTERLSSHNKTISLASAQAKEFRCADGVTLIQYSVLGEYSVNSDCCNFVVVHDFFDTCDATSILFKPITNRHPNCMVLCFNYPGQANTVWPRPPASEKARGAKETVINNDWVADRLHELLQHAETTGEFLSFSTFHIVGIGNGACIAAAFVQRYGSTRRYAASLRSLICINGFLYPDAQLSSILHSASQVFETAPHSRPDIPVAFWSRFQFSDDYLNKIHPNLALNIYTAVNNPITNDGRLRIAKGCLQHRDLRGGLSPENPRGKAFSPVRIPVFLLQSTENALVNASNLDPFLIGRQAKHLWSHQSNTVSQVTTKNLSDINAVPWVGSLSDRAENYARSSTLGKKGLRMILDTIRNPKGAFVVWCRCGHAVQQESKSSLLDLFDALSCPSEEYFGLPSEVPVHQTSQIKVDVAAALTPSIDVLFEIKPSTREVPPELLMEPKSPKRKDRRGAALKEMDTQTDDTVIAEEPTSNLLVAGENNEGLVEGDSLIQPHHEQVEPIPAAVDVERDDVTLDDTPSVTPKEALDLSTVFLAIETNAREQITELDAMLQAERTRAPIISTRTQREARMWTEAVPSVDSALALEAQLRREEALFFSQEKEFDESMQRMTQRSFELIAAGQEERRLNFSQADEELLLQLKDELERRRRAREEDEIQRRLQTREIELQLVKSGLLEPYVAPIEGVAVDDLAPIEYSEPQDLPPGVIVRTDPSSVLDRLAAEEAEAKSLGVTFSEDFGRIKRKMAQRQMEREEKLHALSEEEQLMLFNECSLTIQRRWRGVLGRKKFTLARDLREEERIVGTGVIALQSLVRRRQAKERVALLRFVKYENIKHGNSALRIQTNFRGFLARSRVHYLKSTQAAIQIQRCYRGHLGRKVAGVERDRLLYILRKNEAAMKLQSVWRMKLAKEEFRRVRVHAMAAIEIQRCFRGHIGRKTAKRRRDWETATPGPERIKLGLSLIEESRVAFERQQEELDAIHRAQERAEARVSHIHADLRESEKELQTLERELQEIDQIERDLINLTHEKDLLARGVTDAAGLPKTAQHGHEAELSGKEFSRISESDAERRNKADAFALEMTIQIKRAEREKKRQELEMEFAVVFQEVEKKKKALERLETSLADMEATRERKDREFRRLQSNLMQLLLEQKQELDSLREKGIELETATAMTASAAVATANKAMEHEKRSTAMFSQTEELMKFQFMSMSLSYFSSLNMLKQLRDMNSDTTSSAITSSANAAVAASAASVAANLPSIQKLDIGADDFVELAIQKKRAEVAAAEQAEREAKLIQQTPMPESVQLWTVSDVCRWMDSLLLSQYNEAFREARIDGPFLMELREEDMVEVLGITHKLHVRKIIVSRDKLRPLSEQELFMKSAVDREDTAESIRSGGSAATRGRDQGAPSIDVVFSQCRNGHVKRVEESLNLGFKIDTEDEKGNTLLLVAAQNTNRRLVELLLFRGANINHQNAQGNTALHFAMAYDPEGTLGEYLIEHGANDTLENIHGFTPYDGVGA